MGDISNYQQLCEEQEEDRKAKELIDQQADLEERKKM